MTNKIYFAEQGTLHRYFIALIKQANVVIMLVQPVAIQSIELNIIARETI